MTSSSTPVLPDHRLLNRHRRTLADRPDLTSIASTAAQRLAFVSLLDHLAAVPPFVGMDSLIDEDLARLVDTVLDGEPRSLDATSADLLAWMGAPDSGAERRYSLRLVQWFGCLLDRFGSDSNPAHVVGALHELVALLPEPSVLDLDLGGEMQRFTPSALGREVLGWTGVVCIPGGPYS